MENENKQLKSKNQATGFPEQLRHGRKLRGWSQADLANHLGNDAKSVGRWERGESSPTPYYRYKLLELFGKNAEELGLIERESHDEEIGSSISARLEQSQAISPLLVANDVLPLRKKENEQAYAEVRPQSHETDLSKDERDGRIALLEQERQVLEIERQRLELLEKRLEIQKRQIEYALEVAKKIIDILQPNADEGTRTMLVKALLPDFLHLLTGKGLELTLPAPWNSEEKPTRAEK